MLLENFLQVVEKQPRPEPQQPAPKKQRTKITPKPRDTDYEIVIQNNQVSFKRYSPNGVGWYDTFSKQEASRLGARLLNAAKQIQ